MLFEVGKDIGRPVSYESESHSVMSDSLQPHGLYIPWNFPGQNAGVVKPFPSPGDLPNPGIEPRSPTLQVILYQLSLKGSLQTSILQNNQFCGARIDYSDKRLGKREYYIPFEIQSELYSVPIYSYSVIPLMAPRSTVCKETCSLLNLILC